MIHYHSLPGFFSVIEEKCFKNDQKNIKSFQSECLKIKANDEHCYSKFWYNCETNKQNALAAKKPTSL